MNERGTPMSSLPVEWHYKGVQLAVGVVLSFNGRNYSVPMHGAESMEHTMFKISLVAHLLTWGYNWDEIQWEKTIAIGALRYRPDIYVQGTGSRPSFWFECIATEHGKLVDAAKSLPEFRIVHVVGSEWFEREWSGNTTSADSQIPVAQINDPTERKRAVIERREEMVPEGTECWVLRSWENVPRIVYAVKHERDGHFVYLDTGETYSLWAFPFVSKRSRFFRSLIPGIAGNDDWGGRGAAYLKDDASADHPPI